MKTLVAVAAGVALVLVACSGGSPAPEHATVPAATGVTSATLSASPSPAPSIIPVAIPAATPLVAGAPVPLPKGVVVYALDSAWEGPSAALRRYYTDSAGSLVIDDLFVSDYGERPRALAGMAVGPRGEIAAALCHGWCYGSPLPVTFVRSDDGGVTWRDVITVESGGGRLAAIDGDTLWIRGIEPSDPSALWRVTVGQEPQRVSTPPQVKADASVFAGFVNGEVLLAAAGEDERTLRSLSSGEILVTVPLPASIQWLTLLGFARGTADPEFMVAWRMPGDAPEEDFYLGFLNLSTGTFSRTYVLRQQAGLGFAVVGGEIAAMAAIGRAAFDAADYLHGQASWFRGTVATFDWERARVSPVQDFVANLAGKSGGPVPRYVTAGPFARVVRGDDCLNVRTEPAAAADILGCFADGVLLPLREGAVAGSQAWLPVRTPDGRNGWAAAEFLHMP